jgi:hypothetical protein
VTKRIDSNMHERSIAGSHHTCRMIAGNRRAGGFVLALVLIALCLSVLAVFLVRWKTRRPLPEKSIISSSVVND